MTRGSAMRIELRLMVMLSNLDARVDLDSAGSGSLCWLLDLMQVGRYDMFVILVSSKTM